LTVFWLPASRPVDRIAPFVTLQKERDMGLARPLIVSLTILGLSTPSFAGDLRESIANAAQQQAQTAPRKIDKAYLVPGASLVVAGMAMATYGFLHTKGGEFVSGEVSKESNTGLGAAGLAVAGAGGALLFFGAERARRAATVTIAPDRLTIAKRVSW